MSQRLLIASVHDVAPRFEGEVDRLLDHLAPHVGTKAALLAVPDHWGDSPLVAGSLFAARLRGWAEAGHEVFLHGWFHRDLSEHASAAARMRAKHMTAGEGEFLGLSRDEALRRMVEGRALIEDIIGRPIAGFIAPAWLYGEGARDALVDSGMALAEDHLRVWSPATGRILLRSPVITWASRSRARQASSLTFAAIGRHLPLRTMRVGVHPPDVRVPAIMASITKTMRALGRSRRAGTYRELLEG